MDVYTVSKAFDLNIINQEVAIGDTVSKFGGSVNTLVNATQFPNKAFWQWIGSQDSLTYLTFLGVVPDPTPGTGITEAHGLVALNDGDDFFTLTGAGWSFVPTAMVCIVVKPSAADDNFFATLRDVTLTADGFTVDFQSAISNTGYYLSYFVIL